MKRYPPFLFISFILSLLFIASCDSNHSSEFYRIQRDDIAGYESFIEKYPSSTLVKDAKERIVAAKERAAEQAEKERKEAEMQRLEKQYGSNSLANGSQPYSRWYGKNLYMDDYTPHSEIRVKAPYNSDVVVIVRFNNSNGNVAGHKYITAGSTVTIYLRNNYTYQTFFYYGKGWYPDKDMNGQVRGGFIKNEAFSKDGTPITLENEIITYELVLQENGNFQTSSSSEGEMF